MFAQHFQGKLLLNVDELCFSLFQCENFSRLEKVLQYSFRLLRKGNLTLKPAGAV